jgi:isopenicillin-N epimerase
MVTGLLPNCDTVVVKQRLYDEFRIEVPLTSWDGASGIRVSFQGYNSADDLSKLLDALRVVVPEK